MVNASPDHVALETVSINCPFGMRFRDTATREFVSENLEVVAYLRPDRRVAVTANRSGIFSFHGLPGLRSFEYSDRDTAWNAISQQRFTVEVIDQTGSFLPIRFTIPMPQRIQSLAFDSTQPQWMPVIRLFSAATRRAPGGFGLVRMQLREATSQQPAAWALAAATYQNISTRGLADAAGQLTLLFPYPEPPGNGATPALLSDQQWKLQFEFRHQFLTGATEEPQKFAELDQLETLPPAYAWDRDATTTKFTEAQLMFGRELIAPVRESDDAHVRELLLTPADVPPQP